jgi:hypothetical protein
VLVVLLGVTIAARWKDGKAWTAMLSYVPSVLGTILVAALPGTNKIGLLFTYWISSTRAPLIDQSIRKKANVH